MHGQAAQEVAESVRLADQSAGCANLSGEELHIAAHAHPRCMTELGREARIPHPCRLHRTERRDHQWSDLLPVGGEGSWWDHEHDGLQGLSIEAAKDPARPLRAFDAEGEILHGPAPSMESRASAETGKSLSPGRKLGISWGSSIPCVRRGCSSCGRSCLLRCPC